MDTSPPHPQSPEGGDRKHVDATLPRVLSPEPYVTEAEIEHRMAQELQAQRDANLCLDPRDAELRVRAWLHREQLRRIHPRETDD